MVTTLVGELQHFPISFRRPFGCARGSAPPLMSSHGVAVDGGQSRPCSSYSAWVAAALKTLSLPHDVEGSDANDGNIDRALGVFALIMK